MGKELIENASEDTEQDELRNTAMGFALNYLPGTILSALHDFSNSHSILLLFLFFKKLVN